MKIIQLLLLVIFIPLSGNTQKFVYEMSKPYGTVKGGHKYYFTEKGQVMAVKGKGAVVVIQKWDTNTMDETSRTEYKEFPKKMKIENVSKIQGRYYLFYSNWDKPNLTEELFVREIDFESGKLEGETRRILEVKNRLERAADNSNLDPLLGKFNIRLSPDEAMLLVQYRKKPAARKNDLSTDVIGLSLFNPASMELLSSGEITMPYPGSKIIKTDYVINDKGNVYALASVYEGEGKNSASKEDEPKSFLELMTISENYEIRQTRIKPAEGISVSGVKAFANEKDVVFTGGYIRDEDNTREAEGGITFTINENGTFSSVRKSDYTEDAFTTVVKKGKEEILLEIDSEIRGVRIHELNLHEDGTSIIIGEQYFVDTAYYTDENGQEKNKYEHCFNDILVTKIGQDEEVLWMQRLKKSQVWEGGAELKSQGTMSFKYFNGTEGHYFVFLDNKENIDLDLMEVPQRYRDRSKGIFMAYRIDDKSGEVKKCPLFNPEDMNGISGTQYNINRVVLIEDGEFLIELCKGDREDVLVKVRI